MDRDRLVFFGRTGGTVCSCYWRAACYALRCFFEFLGIALSPCCGASASVTAMQGTSAAACVDISEGEPVFAPGRQPIDRRPAKCSCFPRRR